MESYYFNPSAYEVKDGYDFTNDIAYALVRKKDGTEFTDWFSKNAPASANQTGQFTLRKAKNAKLFRTNIIYDTKFPTAINARIYVINNKELYLFGKSIDIDVHACDIVKEYMTSKVAYGDIGNTEIYDNLNLIRVRIKK